MGAPSQRTGQRPRTPGAATTSQVSRARGDVETPVPRSAGNAALADSLGHRRRRTQRAWDRREGLGEQTAASLQPATKPLLHLQRPVIEIGFDGAPFRRLARARGPSNARSVAAALTGRDGTTAADFAAGVRSSARDAHAGFSFDRHTATVRGRLDNFRAVRLLPAGTPTSTGRRESLDAIAPATTTVHAAGLRIRVDNVDLVRGRTGATVSVDGAGNLELRFQFPDGTVRMLGADRPGATEDVDWTYLVEVDLVPFATVIWRTMPRKRRFTVAQYASGAASPPGDDDGPGPERDDPHRADAYTATANDAFSPRGRPVDGARSEDAGHRGSVDRNGGARERAADINEKQDSRRASESMSTHGPASTMGEAMMGGQDDAVGQRSRAGGVVDAARSYLHGLDVDGIEHPATIERLDALRASLATHDQQAPPTGASAQDVQRADPSFAHGGDPAAPPPVADDEAQDA